MKIRILLTACIKPNSSDALAITKVEERREQYLKAINWYLENTNYDITFCENSGTDISSFINIKERVEVLTYTSKPTMPERGKGYKEMEIIEYAYYNSQYLSNADIIVKGTGRLMLLNIKTVVNYLVQAKAQHFICSWMSIKKQHSDSRFFFCSSDYMKYFISYKENINLHKNFEDNLALSIKQSKKSRYKYIYPLVWYNIKGIGGGFGQVYDISNSQYFKFNIKNMFYKIAFSLFEYWPTKIDKY